MNYIALQGGFPSTGDDPIDGVRQNSARRDDMLLYQDMLIACLFLLPIIPHRRLKKHGEHVAAARDSTDERRGREIWHLDMISKKYSSSSGSVFIAIISDGRLLRSARRCAHGAHAVLRTTKP